MHVRTFLQAAHCTCLFLSPVFLPLKLFHGGGTAGQVKKADDVCLLCKYFMAYAIPFFETHINISIWIEKVTLPAKLFVRIPAGTYPGQRETARSFRSVTKLLLRHHYFLWQIGPIFVYQTVSAVMLSIRTNVNNQTKQYKSNKRIATTMKWIQIAQSLTCPSELSSEQK